MKSTVALIAMFLLVGVSAQQPGGGGGGGGGGDPLLEFQREVQLLAESIRVPAPTKGIPFPTIPGPKCKAARIGVVGAGPSGIDMAYRLKKSGFTNVEVLEQTNRVGGKSRSVEYRNVTNSFSTHLIASDYEDNVVALMKEFGIYNATPLDFIYRTANDFRSPVLSKEEVLFSLGDPRQLLEEAGRFIRLYREIFGTFEGELMPRPTPEAFAGLQGSLDEFFDRNGLKLIGRWLQTFLALNGFKPNNGVSAVQGLLLLTPKLLLDTLSNKILVVRNKGQFQALFDKMIQAQNVNITFNYEVQYIESNPDGSLTVFPASSTLDQSARTYDFLVWSGLARDFARRSLSLAFDAHELEVLASSVPTSIASSLVNMQNDVRAHNFEAYLENLLQPFDSKVCVAGEAYAELNDIVGPTYQTRAYKIDGEDARVRTIMVLLFGNEHRTPSESELEDTIRRFYSEKFNATNIEILVTVAVKSYFPHWSVKNVGRGFHWDLFDMQGRHNVWFIGGGSSFESVKSVMEYNKLLLRQYKAGDDSCPGPMKGEVSGAAAGFYSALLGLGRT